MKHTARGAIAVELALVMLVLFSLLPALLYFARVHWHHNVMHKAVANAALYLASVPLVDVMDPARTGLTAQTVQQIVVDSAAAGRVHPLPSNVALMCDGWQCLGTVHPAKVAVYSNILVQDDSFFDITQAWSDGQPYAVGKSVTVTYAN